MKEVQKNDRNEDRRLPSYVKWVGLIVVLIGIILAIMGVVHASSPSAEFVISYQNSGNIYSVSVAVSSQMPNGSSAELLVLSSAGGLIEQHNFTGNYTTVVTLYENAVVEVNYQGATVAEKVIQVVTAPAGTDYGIFGRPDVILGISIGTNLLIIIIFWRVILMQVRGESRPPDVYDTSLGPEVDRGRALMNSQIVTKEQLDSVMKTIDFAKENGLDIPIDRLLSEKQIAFLNERKELREGLSKGTQHDTAGK